MSSEIDDIICKHAPSNIDGPKEKYRNFRRLVSNTRIGLLFSRLLPRVRHIYTTTIDEDIHIKHRKANSRLNIEWLDYMLGMTCLFSFC